MLITSDVFLATPTQQIADLVSEKMRPRLGVFVPDGSRRLVLSATDAKPSSPEFYKLCATLPAQRLLQSLKVFLHTVLKHC